MKVMAIAAHPDDIEIFMFGLLSIYKARNYELCLVIATDGAAGKVKASINIKKIRKKEACLGLESLGKPIFLNLQDGKLSQEKMARIKIEKEIKNFNPNLIITHPPEDYHKDHRSLSKYVDDVSGFEHPVLYCETLLGVNFIPDFYIDITQYFNLKKKAILKHVSQTPRKFLNAVEITNQFRAAQCNHPLGSFAEVYRYDKRFPFSDIRSLLPPGPSFKPFYINGADALI